MKQIYYIIHREVVTSIRKSSFILFAVLPPIVFLLPFIFILFQGSGVSNKINKIGIIDNANILGEKKKIQIGASELIPISGNLSTYKLKLVKEKNPLYSALIEIPKNVIDNANSILPIKYYVTSPDDINSTGTYEIERFLNSKILFKKMSNYSKDDEISENYSNLKVLYPILVESDNDRASKLASMLAYAVGMLMYLMFIIFNNSLLRGVMEEKANRIVEVFSMVVKPFNLMIGKILGVGIIALVQLVIWVVLSVIYIKAINYIGSHYFHVVNDSSSVYSISYLIDNYKSLPINKMLIFTPIFFIVGFLVNGAITTVVGVTANGKGNSSLSIVSNLINIGSIYIAMFAAGNPDTGLAKISLYIPFFSPIVMPALLPYNIPLTQILLSLSILIITFFILVYLAGKIYRVSIVSFGNKVTMKSLLSMMWKKDL